MLSFSAYDPNRDESYSDSRYTATSWEMLHNPNYSLVIIAYNLHKLGDVNNTQQDGAAGKSIILSQGFKNQFNELKKLVSFANQKGLKVHALSNSDRELVEAFKYELKLDLPFYQFDEKELKTIIRSSPGLLVLKNGVIKGKWHFNDIPEVDAMKSLLKNG